MMEFGAFFVLGTGLGDSIRENDSIVDEPEAAIKE